MTVVNPNPVPLQPPIGHTPPVQPNSSPSTGSIPPVSSPPNPQQAQQQQVSNSWISDDQKAAILERLKTVGKGVLNYGVIPVGLVGLYALTVVALPLSLPVVFGLALIQSGANLYYAGSLAYEEIKKNRGSDTTIAYIWKNYDAVQNYFDDQMREAPHAIFGNVDPWGKPQEPVDQAGVPKNMFARPFIKEKSVIDLFPVLLSWPLMLAQLLEEAQKSLKSS
jgi:hypothetical protein